MSWVMKSEAEPMLYAKWKDFEIRTPTYLDGHIEENEYDVVKWFKEEKPHEVFNMRTGKYEIMDKYCISIARLYWIEEHEVLKFESVGLRYLEHREEGLEKFLLTFCDSIEKEKINDC